MNLTLKTPKKKAKLMTAEEFAVFLDRPENQERFFELVRGEVIELSRPQMPHGVVCANTVRILGNHSFAIGEGVVVSNDTGVVLERDPDTVRGPDIAWYENGRSYEEIPRAWSEDPPRLAVEVLSPNDRADQVMLKINDYLASGVALVWLIDPEQQCVGIYRPDKAPRLLRANEEITGEDVLPGFRCKVADFFFLPANTKKTNGKSSRRKKK